MNRPDPAADQCRETEDQTMLRRLGTKIADAIEFLLNIPNWLARNSSGRCCGRNWLRRRTGRRAAKKRAPTRPRSTVRAV
jgi:hypothetical protein